MRAWKFRKAREKCHWYKVQLSKGLFGSPFGFEEEVLAKSHKQAVYRYKSRYGIDERVDPYTSQRFAHYRVRRSDLPDHHRHIRYF